MDGTWINIHYKQVVHYLGVPTAYILIGIITTTKVLSNYIIMKIITDTLKVITIKSLTEFSQCTWNMYHANLPKLNFLISSNNYWFLCRVTKVLSLTPMHMHWKYYNPDHYNCPTETCCSCNMLLPVFMVCIRRIRNIANSVGWKLWLWQLIISVPLM